MPSLFAPSVLFRASISARSTASPGMRAKAYRAICDNSWSVRSLARAGTCASPPIRASCRQAKCLASFGRIGFEDGRQSRREFLPGRRVIERPGRRIAEGVDRLILLAELVGLESAKGLIHSHGERRIRTADRSDDKDQSNTQSAHIRSQIINHPSSIINATYICHGARICARACGRPRGRWRIVLWPGPTAAGVSASTRCCRGGRR